MQTIRRSWLARTIGGLTLVLGMSAWADTAPTIYDVRPWEAREVQPTNGFGQRAGRAELPGKDRLVIVEPKSSTQVFLTRRTRFKVNGRVATADSLVEGSSVRVYFDQRGNTRIAREVDVLTPPPLTP